ncbi:MAG: hypothetical protein P4K98_13265 [Bryobacteraceae bacterium]|nr:hypothetical protein [Bryobacteraceae bacterium]
MNEVILTCCGHIVTAPPADVTCLGCGTRFTERQVEQLQIQQLEQIPVVDILRAANMLNQTEGWIFERRASLEPMHHVRGLDVVFPITAVRRFAIESNLPLTPRPIENGVLWVNRPIN